MTAQPPSAGSPQPVPGHPGWVWWLRRPGGMLFARRGRPVVRGHNWTVLLARIRAAEQGEDAGMSDMRIELADPEGQLLEEIADPKMKRRDVAMTYRLALRSRDRVDWGKVNRAIIERWSASGLGWIKEFAWGHRDG